VLLRRLDSLLVFVAVSSHKASAIASVKQVDGLEEAVGLEGRCFREDLIALQTDSAVGALGYLASIPLL